MFQHDMAYGDFKDLTRRTASEHLIMLKILNMMDMNADLFQWFDKQTSRRAATLQLNLQLKMKLFLIKN